MIKPIAIYLPQFHTIPENDNAWGEGFTEWTNVKKAEPLFEGHYQPHVPHEDVGFYDLSNPEVLVRQAAMAKEYGIYGFAFYHYWFKGKRLLETPLDNMLKTGTPDFPFLYIWANENWTKRWDGSDNEIIQEQSYSHEDDINHIQFLCENVFNDNRYITIDKKPVFLVYRTEILPDVKKTAAIWRNEVKKYGFKDIFLVRVESFQANIDPVSIGFDCAMEFGPDLRNLGIFEQLNRNKQIQYLRASYDEIVANMIAKTYQYKVFRCVFPTWDNSPRKKKEAIVISNFSVELFSYFLYQTISHTVSHLANDEQFLFINAWNEWGEGCHIEPDQKYQYTILECIRKTTFPENRTSFQVYIDKIENQRKELIRQNSVLSEDNYQYKKAFLSIDYKFGKLFIAPLRYIKRTIYRVIKNIKIILLF